MAQLHQIVEFASFSDDCALKSGTVNRRVSADFHIIFYPDVSNLIKLNMLPIFIGCIPESARANDHSWLKNDPIADLASFTDDDAGMDEAGLADLGIWTHIGSGSNECSRSYFNLFIDHGMGSDCYPLFELGCRMNDSCRIFP